MVPPFACCALLCLPLLCVTMTDDMQGECEAFESLYQIKKRQKEEAMRNWGKDVS